ncbi:MAG: DNA-binding response regulator [Gemmatimonadetes bacterium]|nr:MAG: DNA-binding response regulator [Gemmatimonadota bacterium]
MSESKILIIEDDAEIVDLIDIHIKDLGYELDWAPNGVSGLERAIDGDYLLVIIDWMIPKMDGLEVCRRLRAEKKSLPIIMLTAKSEEFDKVLGLEIGADDYITKPFSLREVMARIKALIRRVDTVKAEIANENKQKEEMRFGELTINVEKRKVTLRGKTVELTAKEFDLLALFASHPGRAYSRQELLDLVWGYQFDGYDHTVNSHINRLRSKIEENPSQPTYIKTVWGVGYRFVEREELPE